MEVLEIRAEDRELLAAVEDLELDTFGRGGLNLWALAPFAGHGRIHAARLDGEVVAYAILMRGWAAHPKLAYLFSFAVRRERQNQGIGSRFLEALIELLGSEGFGRLELTVAPTNVRALHLYKTRFGFEITKVLSGWYGDGEDRFYLSRAIGPPMASR